LQAVAPPDIVESFAVQDGLVWATRALDDKFHVSLWGNMRLQFNLVDLDFPVLVAELPRPEPYFKGIKVGRCADCAHPRSNA
jgi:hypothetical protein